VKHAEARRRDLLGAVRRYASGPLLRLLGARGRSVQVEPALHGKRSLVYFLEVDGLPRMVLRAVPRWPDAWKVAYNLRHLAAAGLPVPGLLAASVSPLTRLRWGFLPIVEERIEGSHVDALGRTEGPIRAVARALARFHAVRRRRWGWLALPRWGSYRNYFLRRLARRARDVDAALQQPRSRELMHWCREGSAHAPLDPPFSLTHSRVYCANFVVTPGGEAYAIDLLECRYGSFAVDLTWALERVCGGQPRPAAWFLDTYFAGDTEGRREAFERSRPFFEAEYHLARSATHARRVRRRVRAGKGIERRLGTLHRHVECLAAITGIDMAVVEP